MLEQQSTTTPTPATTTGQPVLSELIESARENTRIAARIAESFDRLGDVRFSDLDLIARNCYAANRSLETVSRALADANESEAGPSAAVMVSSSEN